MLGWKKVDKTIGGEKEHLDPTTEHGQHAQEKAAPITVVQISDLSPYPPHQGALGHVCAKGRHYEVNHVTGSLPAHAPVGSQEAAHEPWS